MLVHETLFQDRLSTRVSVSVLDRRVCKRAHSNYISRRDAVNRMS